MVDARIITNQNILFLDRKRDLEEEEEEEEGGIMALQWLILSYVVAAEVAIAVILTLPYPMLLKKRIVSLISLILNPAASIVAFAGFQLLGNRLSISLSLYFLDRLISHSFSSSGSIIIKVSSWD